jgi:hypothetical protein
MTTEVPSGEPERTTMKAALALARALRSAKPRPQHGPAAVHAWGHCVEAVGGVLARSNPRFDSQTFYAECGLDRPQQP